MRQIGHELIGAGQSGGGLDFRLAQVETQADIGRDRVVEEERLLGDEGQFRGQRTRGEILQVAAIQADPAS